MKRKPNGAFSVLLADDDADDFVFFREALKDFELPTKLDRVSDGEQLMQVLLDETHKLPQIIFLDLNMPRKNGFECLAEIKSHQKLNQLPVVIYSTSFHKVIADRLYRDGANYYISKPSDISELRKAVQQMITLLVEEKISQPTIEKFILTEERQNYKTNSWFKNFFRLPLEEGMN